jgi:hypothetical protein
VATPDEWTDILDRFEQLDEHLVYVDGPLEGYLRERASGDLFAFYRVEVVASVVWHWVLVSVASPSVPAADVFAAVRRGSPERWMSILEDHRAERVRLSAAWISSATHPIPA